MIKFFRKIRQNLVQENKFSKYLLYAVGEILLVVIGILIALSLNNWNEGRKSNDTKGTILKELKNEFQENFRLIESFEADLTKSNKNLIKVLNYSAGTEMGLSIDSLRTCSSSMFYINNLAIKKSYLDGIIASGNIRLLDSELTALLTGFESEFNSFDKLSKIHSQSFTSESANKLMLNLGYYTPFHERLYPENPLEFHPTFKKNDPDFEHYIKDPDTYSTIYKLYVTAMANKAWTIHLKDKVKNIINNIELNLTDN